VAISEQDLAAWTRRVGQHFEGPCKGIAEAFAEFVAFELGPRLKSLRPETQMADVLEWIQTPAYSERAPNDWVEILMAVEEAVGCEMTDDFAETLERHTFRDYVEHLNAHRRVA
jgi:hypothetical protein